MEKINVNDNLKSIYQNLIRGAQQVEATIGQAEYRIYKMKKQRESIDVELKEWWEKVAEEYNLDKSLDYYVDNDGAINQVERPAATQTAPADPVVDPDVVIPSTPAEPVDNKEGGSVEDLT